ncbi:MAG: hypothetical protein R6U41_01320 [Desulfosalsimonas sp.]|uniref:hypothetical protein n=1 Tax=Desulfosalsimonas sp. TaxID=3073848 RepID=UPI003970F9DC
MTPEKDSSAKLLRQPTSQTRQLNFLLAHKGKQENDRPDFDIFYLYFHEVYPGTVHYTDKIEISAGLLSPLIWLFAHVFYRHRQRRWKLLLERPRGFGKYSPGDKG